MEISYFVSGYFPLNWVSINVIELENSLPKVLLNIIFRYFIDIHHIQFFFLFIIKNILCPKNVTCTTFIYMFNLYHLTPLCYMPILQKHTDCQILIHNNTYSATLLYSSNRFSVCLTSLLWMKWYKLKEVI